MYCIVGKRLEFRYRCLDLIITVLKDLQFLISEALPCVLRRLVMVDIAFYTGNVQALKSLEKLDLNLAEIWEQKR